MQYTLRNIPAALDRMLRRRAKEQGASLNDVALEALARGAGVTEDAVRQRTLRDLAGAWKEDALIDAALGDQRVVDAELWRGESRSTPPATWISRAVTTR
jgi:hypothetical protein